VQATAQIYEPSLACAEFQPSIQLILFDLVSAALESETFKNEFGSKLCHTGITQNSKNTQSPNFSSFFVVEKDLKFICS